MFALAPPAHATERGVDYCRFSQNASLFLVDRTTPYDETDRRVVIDSIGAVIEGLGPGDRITVATIGAHYSVSERVIDECKPGCPAANGPLDAFFGGCSPVIAMRDYRAFQARLVARVRPLTATAQEASASDITGTIAQWTRRPSGERGFANIYLFSDMLENSQALPWRTFRDMRTEQALAVVRQYRLAPSVANANVRIVGFGRLHDPGRPPLPADLDLRLRNFWTAYFAAGSARNVSFEGAITP
jgi:hypothetical protein